MKYEYLTDRNVRRFIHKIAGTSWWQFRKRNRLINEMRNDLRSEYLVRSLERDEMRKDLLENIEGWRPCGDRLFDDDTGARIGRYAFNKALDTMRNYLDEML